MATLNEEVRHAFAVADLYGAAVAGLTGSAFTITLTRRSGSSLISTPETVTVSEIGSGMYWVYYIPTQAATLYRLKIVPVNPAHIVNADEFQDDVVAGSSATSGPYLTTRSNLKTAFGISGTDRDAQIDMLLPQVTDLFQTYCGRNFFEGSVTEYPPALSRCMNLLLAGKPPIISVTSLHISTSIPRVYDSTTLLVEGTDFIVSEDSQWVELVSPVYLSGITARVAKLVYTGGYAVIPGDLERAAQEVIGVKLMKAAGKLYHFLNEASSDGAMQGLRWDDITPNALSVMDAYRLRSLA